LKVEDELGKKEKKKRKERGKRGITPRPSSPLALYLNQQKGVAQATVPKRKEEDNGRRTTLFPGS